MTASELLSSKLNRLAPKLTTAYLTILIILVSFAVYFNALFNGFVYDDGGQIIENPWIKDIHFVPEIFTSSVWSFQSTTVVSNYYRPLMSLVYMLTYYIFGLKPWGFHLLNILFHTGASVLVFIISRRMFSEVAVNRRLTVEGLQSPSAEFTAVIAALLFATHPVHTEAVTWAAGLPDLSYTFFCLISIYFYMTCEDRMNGMYWLSVLSFSVAALCKEPALMLPFILIVYDLAFRRFRPPVSYLDVCHTLYSARFFYRYIPFFIVSGLYLLLRFNALGGFSPQNPHIKLSSYEYIINAFPLFDEYLGKLVLPFNLNAFHVLHPISSAFEMKGITSLAITAAFVVLTFIASKKKRMVFFSLMVIALPLMPSLYIPAVGKNAFAERYLYLPSFGFVLLIGCGFFEARAAKLGLLQGLIIIALGLTAIFSMETISRNIIWKDDLSLYTDTITKSPDAALIHNNLGLAYARENRMDEAVREYKTALSLEPDHTNSYRNLALAYRDQGRLYEAINALKAALELEPDFAHTHYDLANCYEKIDRHAEAITEYKAALELKPDFTDAHYNLGLAFIEQGRCDEAIAEFGVVLQLTPGNLMAKEMLQFCYTRKGH